MGTSAKTVSRELQKRFGSPTQVLPALVKSVQETTCTVDLISTGLVDVENVLLLADDEATEGMLLTPRVGSFVYVGLVENSLDTLYVVKFSEIDKARITIGEMVASLDKESLTLTQGEITLKLAGGKLQVTAGGVSLKGLFGDLAALLTDFKVLCSQPGTPSTALFPATLVKVKQLETKANQLLA